MERVSEGRVGGMGRGREWEGRDIQVQMIKGEMKAKMKEREGGNGMGKGGMEVERGAGVQRLAGSKTGGQEGRKRMEGRGGRAGSDLREEREAAWRFGVRYASRCHLDRHHTYFIDVVFCC
jgi:hypothetical protein